MTDRKSEATRFAVSFSQAINQLAAVGVPSALEQLRAQRGDAAVRADLRATIDALLDALRGWQDGPSYLSGGSVDFAAARPELEALLNALDAAEIDFQEVSRLSRQVLERVGLVRSEQWDELEAQVRQSLK